MNANLIEDFQLQFKGDNFIFQFVYNKFLRLNGLVNK